MQSRVHTSRPLRRPSSRRRLPASWSFLGAALVALAPVAPGTDARADESQTATASTSAPVPSVRLRKVFTGEKWSRPTQLLQRPDDADQLHVLEQGGRVKVVQRSRPDDGARMFIDLTDRVNFGSNEEGLLSLAFHPRFAENRTFYVYYSAKSPRRSVLSRFTAVPGPEGGLDLVGDPASEEVILTVDEPYWNHNGGTVLFGPDGMLYLSVGDGGAAGDPLGAGQDLSTHLAKILRIDVDTPAKGRPYAVPVDNPFVGRADAKPEIWAYGLRNVWRMSFDRETGTLWAGDVGQNRWEEINRIERGGNYGWNLREGRHAYSRGGADRGSTIDPAIEYPRGDGLSVTGGFVYRGSASPGLVGVYLYADYAYGNMWGVRVDGTSVGTPKSVLKKRGLLISSFGEANDGTLYVTAFEGSERGPGAVYEIVGPR